MIPGRLAERFAAPVQPMTFSPLFRADQKRTVIQTESPSAEFIKPRHHPRVHQQLSERLVILGLPAEHPRQLDPAGVPPESLGTSRQPARLERSRLIQLRIDRRVARIDLRLTQHTRNHKVSPQVEEVHLFIRHSMNFVVHVLIGDGSPIYVQCSVQAKICAFSG